MKVLVASDGSEPVARACRLLAQTGLPGDGEIRILAVLSYDLYPRPMSSEWPAVGENEMLSRDREAVEAATGECRRILSAAHGQVSVIHRFGKPATEIMAEIDRWRPDLVVMGRRGLRGVEAWIGSTSEHVMHHAKVPALVAP